MSTYTELIEELRQRSKDERAEADEAFFDPVYADALDKAADAIETLSKGMSAYAKANAELTAWKENAQDWMQRVVEEKSAAERAPHPAAMHADMDTSAPVWIASRKSILEDAEKCVCGHCKEDYGSPEDSFTTIANLWTAYSGYPFEAVDVSMMMALLKIARIGGGRGSEDSFVDLAGYAACGGEIWSRREAFKKEGTA